MIGKEQPPRSSRKLDIAERLQDYVGFLAKPITGSPSASYIQLQWRKQSDKQPTQQGWVYLSGNPEAGRLPRNWPTAVILGVGRNALTGMQPPNVEVQQAVAYAADDNIVRVGVLPAGKRFGYASKAEHEAIAFRHGPGVLRASMGLWLPESQQFVSPPEVEILHKDVPIDRLHRQYPDVILV